MTDEEKIDQAELRTAVGICIKDPALQKLFKFAPDGAREVIKLSFYSTVFPEKMDAHRFRVNLRALESELTEEDLKYLIRFEDDPWLKDRFGELLAARQKNAVAGASADDASQGDSTVRKFHVRRTDGSGGGVDLNAEAVKRKLKTNELRKMEAAKRLSAIRKAHLKAAILKTAVIVAAVLIALAGGVFLWNKRIERQRELAAAEQEKLERLRIQEEAEQAEKERERAEAETRRKEKLAAEQAKRAAERAMREKEDAERRRLAEEKAQMLKDVRDRISRIDVAFEGVRLLPWGKLPKAQRPGAVEATFFCIVPEAQGSCGYYEVLSHPKGELSVVQLRGGEGCEDVSIDDWNRRLWSFGGLIHDGSSAYLFLPKSTESESPCLRQDIDPSRLRLGELATVIRTKGISMESFSFDVRVHVPKVLKTTSVDMVGFGEMTSYETIRNKICEIAATRVGKGKPKKIRRTIELYDGSITKRQINGVTLLPRNPTHRTPQYLAMLREARRQERETEESEQATAAHYDEKVDKKANDMLNAALISIAVRVSAK